MVLLDIYVSSRPWVPNHYRVPAVGPGDQKHTECVVIKQVHAIVLHSGRYAPAGLGPLDQAISSRWVSVNHGKKRLVAAIR
jgi:hypothetical protein